MKSFKGGGENCIHLVIIVLLVVIIAMLMMNWSKNSRYEHFAPKLCRGNAECKTGQTCKGYKPGVYTINGSSPEVYGRCN